MQTLGDAVGASTNMTLAIAAVYFDDSMKEVHDGVASVSADVTLVAGAIV